MTRTRPVDDGQRTVLVIEDDRHLAGLLSEYLGRRGCAVQSAYGGAAALALAVATRPRLILLDLRLGDVSGVQVLARLRAALPDAAVVMMTGNPDLDSAIAAVKGGALDYLVKPFGLDALDAILQRVFGATDPADAPPVEGSDRRRELRLVAASPAMRELERLVSQLGASNARAALITGESGTGKELVARLLHAGSARRDGPFIEVNCAAISESLFESEFFGHERGAFTGAITARRGLAELADRGTLFLDEIGEMPRPCQAKLLRFLEDQTFFRVGGSRRVRTDVAVVAATNRNLREMVEQQTFRQDLYFRLNVVAIQIPPLRERPEDILPLARYWLDDANRRYGKRVAGFTEEAERRLCGYAWPGNVRELRNLIERLVLLVPHERIGDEDLPPEIARAVPPARPAAALADVERSHIESVLARVGGNKTKAAAILGISRQTLRAKLSRDRSDEA